MVHGPHGAQILMHHGMGGPAPLIHIAQQAARQPDIIGRGHIDLQVQAIADPLVTEQVNAFHDNHIGRRDRARIAAASVDGEIVDRPLDGLARFQRGEMLGQKAVIARLRMVEIEIGGVKVGLKLSFFGSPVRQVAGPRPQSLELGRFANVLFHLEIFDSVGLTG